MYTRIGGIEFNTVIQAKKKTLTRIVHYIHHLQAATLATGTGLRALNFHAMFWWFKNTKAEYLPN